MTPEQLTALRDWITEEMDSCFGNARNIEEVAIESGDTTKAQNVFLWRARGTVFHRVLQHLEDK